MFYKTALNKDKIKMNNSQCEYSLNSLKHLVRIIKKINLQARRQKASVQIFS